MSMRMEVEAYTLVVAAVVPPRSARVQVPTNHSRQEPEHRIVGTGRRQHVQVYYPRTHPTTIGKEAWRNAWERAGRPYVHGAVVLGVEQVEQRPGSHYNRLGLSAEGLRNPHPDGRKPDDSNVRKLAEDALKGYGMDDDTAVIGALPFPYWSKRWGVGGERARVELTVCTPGAVERVVSEQMRRVARVAVQPPEGPMQLGVLL